MRSENLALLLPRGQPLIRGRFDRTGDVRVLTAAPREHLESRIPSGIDRRLDDEGAEAEDRVGAHREPLPNVGVEGRIDRVLDVRLGFPLDEGRLDLRDEVGEGPHPVGAHGHAREALERHSTPVHQIRAVHLADHAADLAADLVGDIALGAKGENPLPDPLGDEGLVSVREDGQVAGFFGGVGGEGGAHVHVPSTL